MLICKVQGKCVATIKSKNLIGNSLVTVQVLNGDGKISKDLNVAIDTIGCSIGETVIVVIGTAARNAIGNISSSADMAIVGIVDNCDFI